MRIEIDKMTESERVKNREFMISSFCKRKPLHMSCDLADQFNEGIRHDNCEIHHMTINVCLITQTNNTYHLA